MGPDEIALTMFIEVTAAPQLGCPKVAAPPLTGTDAELRLICSQAPVDSGRQPTWQATKSLACDSKPLSCCYFPYLREVDALSPPLLASCEIGPSKQRHPSHKAAVPSRVSRDFLDESK
jgi:hypothetical protein